MATSNALAPRQPVNQLGLPSFNPYVASLMQRAAQEYPFIRQHNPVVTVGDTGQDYAETWPVNEPGAPGPNGEPTRPAEFGVVGKNARLGVMVGKPNDFTHHDLAAEILHIDPYAREISGKLQESWTPAQLKALKKHSGDYQSTLDEPGRTEADAIQNATDSAIRGTVVNQWPPEVNQALNYSPAQQQMLQSLSNYMRGNR